MFGIIQPTIIPLSSDTLLLLARTRKSKFIAKSISHDCGKTWSECILTNLANPNSAIDAVHLQDGRLLLVYNNSFFERTPLNVAISSNNGKTWKDVVVLEKDKGEFSYPSVIQKKNGEIVITYTWNKINIKEVILDPKKF